MLCHVCLLACGDNVERETNRCRRKSVCVCLIMFRPVCMMRASVRPLLLSLPSCRLSFGLFRARRSGAIAVSLVSLIQPVHGFVKTSVRPRALSPTTSGGKKIVSCGRRRFFIFHAYHFTAHSIRLLLYNQCGIHVAHDAGPL